MSLDRITNTAQSGCASPPNGMQPLPAAEWVAALFDQFIHKYGGEITLNEIRVMNQIAIRYLQGSSPIPFPRLVPNIPVKRSTISRVVSRLVQRGYICEKIDSRDRRRRLIYVKKSFAADIRKHLKLLQTGHPEESRGRFILRQERVSSNSNIGRKSSPKYQASTKQVDIQTNLEVIWPDDSNPKTHMQSEDSRHGVHLPSNHLSVMDGWQKYLTRIPRAPFSRKKFSGIAPSLYTWKDYKSWVEHVRRNWSKE